LVNPIITISTKFGENSLDVDLKQLF